VRWGRINVRDYKEKWGTVRVYCNFGWYQIHSITHPRYCYSQYPKWLWKLDCRYGHHVTSLLNWIVVPYHKWLYQLFYRRAIRKWPHLRLEILSGADYSKLLEKYGVHHIQLGPNMYETRYDWHPDNFQPSQFRYPDRHVTGYYLVVFYSECQLIVS